MRSGLFVCSHLLLGATVAAASAALGAAPVSAGPLCHPSLAVRDVGFSATHPETTQRRWSATVLVDASRCATTFGRFEIMFTRQKENGPEADFVEPFVWMPGDVKVSVEFWADEAVEAYRLTGIAACPCRD